MAAAGSTGTVELITYRPGYEAVGIEPLVDAVRRSHRTVFQNEPAAVGTEVSSMWRDTNAFVELGIPALSYAPRASSHASRKAIRTADLVDAARVYALIALDICDLERAPWTPLGSHVNSVVDGRRPIDGHGRPTGTPGSSG